MATRRHRTGTLGPFGLLCAILALVGQLSSGAIAQNQAARASTLAAFAAVSITCHSSPATGPAHRAPHRHGKADPALCPLRAAIALPAPVPSPPLLAASAPVAARVAAGLSPPARGPPPATARVGAPRAPPIPA